MKNEYGSQKTKQSHTMAAPITHEFLMDMKRRVEEERLIYEERQNRLGKDMASRAVAKLYPDIYEIHKLLWHEVNVRPTAQSYTLLLGALDTSTVIEVTQSSYQAAMHMVEKEYLETYGEWRKTHVPAGRFTFKWDGHYEILVSLVFD